MKRHDPAETFGRALPAPEGGPRRPPPSLRRPTRRRVPVPAGPESVLGTVTVKVAGLVPAVAPQFGESDTSRVSSSRGGQVMSTRNDDEMVRWTP